MKLKRVFCTIVRFSQYLDTLAKSYSYDHIFSSHRPSPFSMSTVPGVFCGTILGRNIPVLYIMTVSLLNVNALAFLIPVPTESGSTEKPSLHIFKMRLWDYLTIFSGIKCILVWVYASVPSTNFLTLSQMYRQAVVKT